MKIYFAGSILGGRKYEKTYQVIVDFLKSLGHLVLTEHVAYPEKANLISNTEVFLRDMARLSECDLLIAEISNPSLGVGFEIAVATQLNKPVLCIYESGLDVSSLILGNTSNKFLAMTYTNLDDLKLSLQQYFNEVVNKY